MAVKAEEEIESEQIEVYGARVHNLKNIDVSIPRNKLTVITGLSGSGKSSLAFDTIFADISRPFLHTHVISSAMWNVLTWTKSPG